MSSRASPRRDRLRSKVRTGPRDFDSISKEEINEMGPRMSRVFARYAFIAAFLHAVVIGITVGEFLLVPWWTLYGRIIVAVRLLLLVLVAMCACCCGAGVRVASMYGSGMPGKVLRSLRPTPILALWLILGYVDLYAVRIPSIFLDAASFLIPRLGQSVQEGLLRAAIGFAMIFEFHLTLNLVYQQGVRRNVRFNLLMKPAPSQSRIV